MIHSVTSRANSKVKMAAALEKSSSCRKRNRFLMEGPKFIHDHLARGGQIDFIAVSEDASDESLMVAKIADNSGFVVIKVPDHIYKCISKTEAPQGITAICPTPEHTISDIFTGGTVLVLDKVADPGNAGTAIRSAAAFGCSGIVFLKGSAYPWSPKVTRSSAGLNTAIPICEKSNLADIPAKFPDYCILGAQSNGISMDKVFSDLTKPVCIVTGSEAHGLSETSQSTISGSVSIPMTKGVESLNAGVSASILLSTLFRKSS